MSNLPIKLPPGVSHNGTQRQSIGRWWLSHLVRWQEGALRPWLGWITFGLTTLTGSARAMLTWVDNASLKWAAIGTNSKLYVMDRTGTVSDITPAAFVTGGADAIVGGGYGSGIYGAGTYGAAGTDPGLITDCLTWSFGTFGQNLIACPGAPDGRIFKWSLVVGTPAALIAAAPVDNIGIVVTGEGVIFALGAGANPRLVQWCDIRDETAWTPGLPSIAGSFPLQTGGRLMCGKQVKDATLLWTDIDVHRAEFSGNPANPYGFERIGIDCGVISQGAACPVTDTLTAWMGRDGFWGYDGNVSALPCDVSGYVFGDLNKTQVSKITSINDPAAGECRWFYPSSGSLENDRYVGLNYRSTPIHWTLGNLARTCGAPKGAFTSPLMVSSSGTVYQHETGFNYTGAADPYVESGPIEFGNADSTFVALNLIPDETAVGGVQATFYVRLLPTGPEQTFGPYTATSRTNVRFTAREARLRLTGAGTDWRIGNYLLDARLGGTK